jgi:3-dehydroquinate synthase
MKSNKIIVNTKSKTYPIFIGNKNIKLVGSLIKKKLPKVKKICVIVDKKVPQEIFMKLKNSLKRYDVKIYKLSVNEKIKNFKLAYKLIEFLIKGNFNKSDCLISLGGGVVGDLSAFVSSLVKRGIRFINIPTTLLAQVDSSIGGKTAVNSDQGKNLIGTIYQPDFVLIDISVLKSLPKREVICGYGEILKHSLILDRKFFFWLTKNGKKIIKAKDEKILSLAIAKSCKIKSLVVSKDENEKNLRMILNFGHTFAHGFEGANNFSKKINHGEAVLLGMIMACQLSYKKKYYH